MSDFDHGGLLESLLRKRRRSEDYGRLRVVFGPATEGMSPHEMQAARGKLESVKLVKGQEPLVKVVDEYQGEECVVIASPYSSEEKIAKFIRVQDLRGKRVITFAEWKERLMVDRNWLERAQSREWWNSQVAELDWHQAREKVEESSSEVAKPQPQADIADPEYVENIPASRRSQVRLFRAHSLALGMSPDGIASLEEAQQDVYRESQQVADQRKANNNRERYFSYTGATASKQENLNEHITKWLSRYCDQIKWEENKFHSRAYAKAADFLKSYARKVETLEDVEELVQRAGKGVFGASMTSHIREIIQTGELAACSAVASNPRVKALEELTQLHGIGPKVGETLVQLGVLSIKDLVSESGQVVALNPRVQAALPTSTKLILPYAYDLLHRIPREEAEAICERVQTACQSVWPIPGMFFEMAGSYRRGRETVGDIDLIMSPPKGVAPPQLSLLTDRLSSEGLMLANLGSTNGERLDPDDKQTFMGVIRLPGRKARRIDIKVYPRHMLPFALLYFTGDDYYNRSLRHYCRNNGLCLNDEGLFIIIRPDGHQNKSARSVVSILQATTEREVVEYLGFPYIPPDRRDSSSCHVDLPDPDLRWKGSPEALRLIQESKKS